MVNLKTYLFLFFLLIFFASISCAQKSDSLSDDFKTRVYNNYCLTESELIPREYWYNMDKYLNLNREIDSVLFVRINGEIDCRKGIPKNEKTARLRLEDLHKCSSLGFFEFNSSSNFDKSQNLVNFTNFPELRYVHSDYLLNENQLTDLLCTAKKLKGLKIEINFPVPDCICELEDLRYLIITNYGEVSLPKCIKDIPNLKYLALIGGGIGFDGVLNQTIWNIPSLELLTIDGGAHVEIKPTVKNMNHLKHLQITSVDSISFPSEFAELDSLELLEIRWIDQKISFPENFNQLKGLKGIKIAQVSVNQLPITNNHEGIIFMNYSAVNEIESLKNLQFFNLPKLKHLRIQGAFSELDSIPKGIQSLPSLETIELYGFGFPHNHDFIRRVNKYVDRVNFGGNFISSFYYYRWLYLLGKPSPFHSKMY